MNAALFVAHTRRLQRASLPNHCCRANAKSPDLLLPALGAESLQLAAVRCPDAKCVHRAPDADPLAPCGHCHCWNRTVLILPAVAKSIRAGTLLRLVPSMRDPPYLPPPTVLELQKPYTPITELPPPMLVGHGRVSPVNQGPEAQIRVLEEHAREMAFLEAATGRDVARPRLSDCLSCLGSRNSLAVWRFEWIGRQTPHLPADLRRRDYQRVSLAESAACEDYVLSESARPRAGMGARTALLAQCRKHRHKPYGKPSVSTSEVPAASSGYAVPDSALRTLANTLGADVVCRAGRAAPAETCRVAVRPRSHPAVAGLQDRATARLGGARHTPGPSLRPQVIATPRTLRDRASRLEQ